MDIRDKVEEGNQVFIVGAPSFIAKFVPNCLKIESMSDIWFATVDLVNNKLWGGQRKKNWFI